MKNIKIYYRNLCNVWMLYKKTHCSFRGFSWWYKYIYKHRSDFYELHFNKSPASLIKGIIKTYILLYKLIFVLQNSPFGRLDASPGSWGWQIVRQLQLRCEVIRHQSRDVRRPARHRCSGWIWDAKCLPQRMAVSEPPPLEEQCLQPAINHMWIGHLQKLSEEREKTLFVLRFNYFSTRINGIKILTQLQFSTKLLKAWL